MSLHLIDPTENELAPLEQIRKIEAEITSQIAAARMSAGRSVNVACSEAVKLKQRARQEGDQEGEAYYAREVAQAKAEGKALVSQASLEAEQRTQRGQANMEEIVDRVVNFILAWESEWSES